MSGKIFKLKKFCRFYVFLILILALSFVSCANSVGSMLSDYNSGFSSDVSVKKSSAALSPGDDGFNADNMLRPTYFVASDATLNLYGPEKCASYKWKLLQIAQVTSLNLTYSVEKSVAYSLSNGSSETSRAFVLYVPSSGLETGTYKLTLTVTDKEGKEYSDNCKIVVYQP